MDYYRPDIERSPFLADLFKWLSEVTENHLGSAEILIQLDVIGSTQELVELLESRNFKESDEGDKEFGLRVYQRIVFVLNYALGLVPQLEKTLGLEGMARYAGNNGDEINIIAHPAFAILLASVIKHSRIGKNLRTYLLVEKEDWKYETIYVAGQEDIHYMNLNSDNIARIPKDLQRAHNSLLVSPTLTPVIDLLVQENLLNPFYGIEPQFGDQFSLFKTTKSLRMEVEVKKCITLVTRSTVSQIFNIAAVNSIFSKLRERNVEINPNDYNVNIDASYKSLIWQTLLTDNIYTYRKLLQILHASVYKNPDVQFFIGRNKAAVATLINNERIFIDPMSTNGIGPIIKNEMDILPGIFCLNPSEIDIPEGLELTDGVNLNEPLFNNFSYLLSKRPSEA